jgi:hypothetical protein
VIPQPSSAKTSTMQSCARAWPATYASGSGVWLSAQPIAVSHMRAASALPPATTFSAESCVISWKPTKSMSGPNHSFAEPVRGGHLSPAKQQGRCVVVRGARALLCFRGCTEGLAPRVGG